jgi:hypothetical protein
MLANYFLFYGDEETAFQILEPLSVEELMNVTAYRVSLGEALKMTDRRSEIRSAIADEILNLKETGTLRPLSQREVTKQVLEKTIPCHMFLKFKYKADGSFDKVKARLAANGDKQDPDTIGETFAPTVNPVSVKTHLNITVREQLLLSAYDIKGAFLMTLMEEARKQNGDMIYIRIPKKLAEVWLEFFPEDELYVLEDGTMICCVETYLYGLAESPNRFNKLFDETMLSLGFKSLRADRCMYIKHTKRGKIIVSVHVDDMLMSCTDLKDRELFEKYMSRHFDLVAQRDTNISYLGMNIQYDRENRKLKISQDGMIKDLLKKYHCEDLRKFPTTPAVPDIFSDPKDINDNPAVNRKEFLSLVMTLMYLARFTRHDILLPVTALATRCTEPRRSDMSHALRIVKYLAGNQEIAPVFDGNVPLNPAISADASHCIYFTGHGHGGIIITLGSAPILCLSFKLKMATRSSSESELVVCEEASTYAVWLKLLMKELGLINHDKPITIYQDNLSTIIIAEAGAGNFKRTKHLLSRELFVCERIAKGDVQLLHKRSAEMSADFLTKALPKAKLFEHLAHLHMLRD